MGFLFFELPVRQPQRRLHSDEPSEAASQKNNYEKPDSVGQKQSVFVSYQHHDKFSYPFLNYISPFSLAYFCCGYHYQKAVGMPTP